MTLKLHHPLWTHAPATLLWLGMIAAFWQAAPFSASIRFHFGPDGRPNAWVAPWLFILGTSLAALALIVISVFLDEVWARDERQKSFNWMSFFDEVVVALIVARVLEQLQLAKSPTSVIHNAWGAFGVLALGAIVLGTVVELLRPCRPSTVRVVEEDTRALQQQVAERRRLGQLWAYWEIQGERGMRWIVGVAVLALVSIATFQITTSQLTGATIGKVTAMLVTAAFVGFVGGGLRVIVTPKHLCVRMGLARVLLLRLALVNITGCEVHRFSPLKDFARLGGFWIRLHGDMWGFFMRGNTGVRVTTRKGWKYLIGSDHPERLAVVIRAASGLHPVDGTGSDEGPRPPA